MNESWYIDPDAAGDEPRVHVQGECVYCENTAADVAVMSRGAREALRVRCEGCGAVTELPRTGEQS